MANFNEGVGLTVSGRTTWAQLTEASGPNKFSNKYQVELTLDEDSINKLKAVTKDFDLVEFLDIKTQEGNKKYVTPTIRLKTNTPPRVWGMDKQPYTGYINNGSFISARIFIKAWEMANKKGLTCYVNEAAVLMLAENADFSDGPSDELFNVKAPISAAPAQAPAAPPVPDAATAAAFTPLSNTNDLPF
jgi:hypothetical protein